MGAPRAEEGHAGDPADHRAVPQGAAAGRDADSDPPKPPRLEPGPADRTVSIAQEGRRPLCDGPRPEVLGAERTQVEERTSDLDFRRYPYTPKPMSPARRESIIRRMFQSMGSLALLLPFVLAGGPGEDSARPERRGDSGRFAQPMIEDGSPVGSIPCLMGQDWLSDPLEVVFHPRNQQNEPKDGGFSPVLPARTRSLADRSRGPPGSGIDLAAADRRSSEPGKTGRSGTRAPLGKDGRSDRARALISSAFGSRAGRAAKGETSGAPRG